MTYDFHKIEKKWQAAWKKKGQYSAKDQVKGKDNFYHLVMFPYPSGNLHIGHWYNFAPADVYARYMRMQDKNVMSPIGFDAFGLPAENAAIKNGIHPEKWTMKNIKMMRTQLESMGNSYDWSRMVVTCLPDYYKWNQWLFLQLFHKGLAYRKKAPANWCPNDKTVLANEQVVDGKCERCGTDVVKKDIEQWLFKITDYAEQLLNDLDKLDWPERTKLAQKNWIGRSEGAEIDFAVKGLKEKIKVFTTRPDTLFGATYMVLAPEHPLVANLLASQMKSEKALPAGRQGIANWGEVEKYIAATKKKTDIDRLAEGKEKTGVELKSIKAINPANKEEIPVFIADYVLSTYGTGAIMAVPAHDERDIEFARKFNIPIRYVIDPVTGSPQKNPAEKDKIVALVENAKGEILTINWGANAGGRLLIGGTVESGEDIVKTAKREVLEETGYRNLKLIDVSKERVHHQYFSYNRNKGFLAHTTLVYFRLENNEKDEQVLDDTEKGKFSVEWVTKDQVRKEINESLHRYTFDKFIEGTAYSGDGVLINSGKFNGLTSEGAKGKITEFVGGTTKVQYRLRDWLISRQRYWGTPIPIIHCPKCGEIAVPEKELPVKLPPLKDFKPADDGRSPLARNKKFLHTKCPKCGGAAERDTDTMDTFVDSSWYYLRYVDPKNKKRPFDPLRVKKWLPVNMYIGGAEHTVLHLLYSRFFTKFLRDIGLIKFDEPFKALRHQGIILGPDGQKMSKSRGNVIDPDKLVREFGTDAVRTYLCFMGEYSKGGPWNPTGILGAVRFLERFRKFFENYNPKKKDSDKEIQPLIHKTIKKVGDDIASFQFNTAVSALMIMLNELEQKPGAVGKSDFEMLAKLIAPMAPHMAEELWVSVLKNKPSIHFSSWPKYDAALTKENEFELVVQINGKVRDSFRVPIDITEAEAKKLTLEREVVKRYLAGREVKRVIYVPGRLISIVL